MGIILTATAGLCLWIILWATGIFGGFDAMLPAVLMVLIAVGVHLLLPSLPGRRD
jgi:hypothetical protein